MFFSRPCLRHTHTASVTLTPEQIIALRPDAPLSDDQLGSRNGS